MLCVKSMCPSGKMIFSMCSMCKSNVPRGKRLFAYVFYVQDYVSMW